MYMVFLLLVLCSSQGIYILIGATVSEKVLSPADYTKPCKSL